MQQIAHLVEVRNDGKKIWNIATNCCLLALLFQGVVLCNWQKGFEATTSVTRLNQSHRSAWSFSSKRLSGLAHDWHRQSVIFCVFGKALTALLQLETRSLKGMESKPRAVFHIPTNWNQNLAPFAFVSTGYSDVHLIYTCYKLPKLKDKQSTKEVAC